MTYFVSNRELDELGDSLIRHFLEQSGMQNAAKCIDIVGLANYLGLNVVFESFAEPDLDKIGFLADGKTPLLIKKDNGIVPFLFPLGTIVLDVSLHKDRESGRCRFTIAHEIAHFVLNRHRPEPQFQRMFDPERNYSLAEISDHFNIVEAQADRLAANILMPQFTIGQALYDFHKGKPIIIFGQNVVADREQKVIRKMAAQVGVSYTAMLIRLKQFDMLEYHPIEEYLDKTIRGGA
ncbi:MAG: ImmA/IrrE family metallo-endopeptidase [Lachnospiraceae bacterium]|nr:ImmA/IrrE family metallo-endopeptidase [Lachnospiraceae bacterium]